MTTTPQTRIAGPTLGTPELWIEYIRRNGGKRMEEVERFVKEAYRLSLLSGISAHLIIAQAIHETDMFRSSWWVERLNPAGIGITGDPKQNDASRTFPNGTIAARAMLVHVALYVFGELAGELALYRHEDPRADAIPGSVLGQRQTLQEFGDDDWRDYPTWAADDNYGRAWARRVTDADAAGVLTGTIEPPKENDMAGWQEVQFVGAKGPVLLPDDIEVIIDIVPDRFIGWVRSGQRFTGQTKTTFHDPGVPGQNAWSQRNYLHNGPSENGQRRQVGFNFASDDQRIIQLTPLDEVTWAAGTPEGNRTSWHNEACYGGGINWDRSLRNAVALHGGLCQMMGWSVDTALVKHQHWFGKWCPAQVLNRGLWPSVVRMTGDAALAAAGAATGGAIPPSAPVYAEPVPIPELDGFRGKKDSEIPYRVNGDGWVALYVGDRVKATRATPRLRFSAGDERVGADVAAGQEFDVDWLLISADFPDTYLTPWLTRIRADDTVRVADVKQDAVPAEGG